MTKNQFQTRFNKQIKKAFKELGHRGVHTAPVSELLQELENSPPYNRQELIETLASYYNCDNEIIYYKTQYKFFNKFAQFCEESAGELYSKLCPDEAVTKMAYAGWSNLGAITAGLLNIDLEDLEQ